MEMADTDARAGVTGRQGVPELDFLFLVYPEAGTWVGVSIRTGHMSEGATPESAVDLLKEAIDASIEFAASQAGVSPSQWYESQELAPLEYVERAICALGRSATEPKEEAVAAQGYVRRFAVCSTADAA